MIEVEGRRVLVGDRIVQARLTLDGDRIAGVDRAWGRARRSIDAGDFLVLPGIVDIHGDAFERQLMPRGGVFFDPAIALADTDGQLIANGVTTAFHGVTISWEPGLRSLATAERLVAVLDGGAAERLADHRLHLRIEPTAVEAIDRTLEWFGRTPPPLVAINDHFDRLYAGRDAHQKLAPLTERSGLGADDFVRLMEEVAQTADRRDAVIERVAETARAAGLVILSHDDPSPAVRERYRALGSTISEFPTNRETAAHARAAGEAVVMGAPNVIRGGSHLGLLGAADAVMEGLCTVLASDYYYAALLHAPFHLVRERGLPLGKAWALVAENPARAAGLDDRGALAEGQRADLLLVDDSGARPRLVAVIAAGRLVYQRAEFGA